MKVCYVTSSFPPFSCGVGDHVARVAAALVRRNVEVTVLTSAQIEKPDAPPGVVVKSLIPAWNLRGWALAVREVLSGSFDCVHFEYPTRYPGPRSAFLRFLPHTLPFALLSWFKGKPVPRVLTVHEYYQSGALVRLKIQVDALLSARVLVVTQADERLLKRNPLLRSKVRFMPVGANIPIRVRDDARTEAIRREYKIAPDEVLICFFGILAPSRGFEDLISAVDILSRQGTRVRVFVIGLVWDETYLSKLQRLAGSTGVGAAFVWLGLIEDAQVADYLQACDLTVQPYLNGVTSNRSSIIATIALGVPAVTTHVVGVTPEDFCNEENVLFVSPNAPREIAAAVLRLRGDERLRRTLTEGMKKLASRLNWEGTATVSAQAYRSLLRPASG